MHTLIVLIEKGKKCWNTNARQKHRQQRREKKEKQPTAKSLQLKKLLFFGNCFTKNFVSFTNEALSRCRNKNDENFSLSNAITEHTHFSMFLFLVLLLFFFVPLSFRSANRLSLLRIPRREKKKEPFTNIFFLTNWCRNSRFEMRDSDTVYRYPIRSWIEF